MPGEEFETSRIPTGRATPQFLVGQDADGHWIAVETQGRGGGLFVTFDAALHYALAETAKRPGAVSIAARPIALTLAGPADGGLNQRARGAKAAVDADRHRAAAA